MFFLNDLSYTKYGYFDVDGIKTLSKIEAWKLCGGDIKKIKYIFNDDQCDALDWSIEPTESITELYRQRAQQLRQDYDYLVLIYSGGIDSHTILESFVNNGIKLDEICSFGNPTVADKDKSINREVLNTAVPFVQSLDLNKLGTKFRFIDIGEMMIKQFADESHYENFEHYSMNVSLWMGTASSHVFKKQVAEHQAIADQGKRICYIWGFDKPHMVVHEGWRHARYTDTGSGYFGPKSYYNREILKNRLTNFYDEPFYICREFPQITIKQCHMLARFMNSLDPSDDRIKEFHQIPTMGPFVQYDTDRWLSKRAVDSCIYPDAILDMFKDDKRYGGSVLFSSKEKWFYDADHSGHTLFRDKMFKVLVENKDLFKFKTNADGSVSPHSYQPLFSKMYQIAKKTL